MLENNVLMLFGDPAFDDDVAGSLLYMGEDAG